MGSSPVTQSSGSFCAAGASLVFGSVMTLGLPEAGVMQTYVRLRPPRSAFERPGLHDATLHIRQRQPLTALERGGRLLEREGRPREDGADEGRRVGRADAAVRPFGQIRPHW